MVEDSRQELSHLVMVADNSTGHPGNCWPGIPTPEVLVRGIPDTVMTETMAIKDTTKWNRTAELS